ncbi:hypothetical protein [Thalassotalea mangrovi]|uniref:Uncharacterized protein n=1 Tax=Thalassotalea mangrovi TaxID=2572245 RepID=A0A4U1B9B3_9GAMM|nr:hypothetical protein [Thalassotalea mangrovi]TKB47165.1 hypothetical protein E8M12_02585 [Thalassotalea mangrovi]
MIIGREIYIIPLVLSLVFSNHSFAGNHCEDSEGVDKRLCEKMEQILVNAETTNELLGEVPGITDQQKAANKKVIERAKKAHGRTKPEEFKNLARKKNKSCFIAEAKVFDELLQEEVYQGDGDGVCQPSERSQDLCQEVVGDGVGNDDGFCIAQGRPNEREVCLEVCYTEEDEESEQLGEDLAEGLDDIITLQESANASLEEFSISQKQNLIAAQIESEEISAFSAAACDPGGKVFERKIDNGYLWASLVAKIAMENIADSAWVVCNQDVAGFNSSSACLVSVLIKLVFVGQYEMLANADGNRTGERIDFTQECVTELSSNIGELKSGQEETDALLKDVQDGVLKLEQQVIRLEELTQQVQSLLLTPQGQRPGYQGK